jgi:TonB family protein
MGTRNTNNRTRLAGALSVTLSVALHIVLVLVLWVQPKSVTPPKAKSVVELITPDELAQLAKQHVKPDVKGQIVDQSEKALNDETPTDAKYLSRHNQVVERQTVAAVHGRFKNTDQMGGRPQNEKRVGKTDPQPEREIKKPAQKHKELLTSADGLVTLPTLKDLTPSFKPSPRAENFAAGGGDGPSATDDRIHEPKGLETLLSSREFVYFAYYDRIKNKLRQYWEPKIKEKMTRAMREGRSIAAVSDRVTKVIICLDSKGTLVKVQVVDGSGVRDLDEAAVEAFRAAAPFPNPPKGIIEPDGLVKINWDFVIEA